MTMASSWSVALIGAEGTMVEVEVATAAGLPRTVLVGLADTALHEAKDRCKAAFASTGLVWPNQLLTINLTPASLPKTGSHYDLAIVAAILAATGVAPGQLLKDGVLFGELGLDGKIRPVPGLLPALLAARKAGREVAVVPDQQYRQATLVPGLTVWPVSNLAELIQLMNGHPTLPSSDALAEPAEPTEVLDCADVRGQSEPAWALEVAAAGGHHVLLHGSPGVGKTMLAERLPTILPDLDEKAALEVSALHSLAGSSLAHGLITKPPFSQPHHNVSLAALIGGGSRVARPGAISLAHRGVLFLDEAPQFGSKLLDALRTPLESGVVTILRSYGQVSYPAKFQLVLAANPCPCGMRDNPKTQCNCTPISVRRYREKLSGPILDRIDIYQQLLPSTVPFRDATPADHSADIKQRVLAARQRQLERLKDTPWQLNAEVPGAWLAKLPRPEGLELLDGAIRRGLVSSRAVNKIIRLAWTLADLSGHDAPVKADVAAAMSLRDRGWGNNNV